MIPPMSLVFEHGKRSGDVVDVSAHTGCIVAGELKARFRGVSISGSKPGGLRPSSSLLSVVVRGEANVMAPYSDLKNLSRGQCVKIKQPARGAIRFRAFEDVQTFSLQGCTASDDECIGIVTEVPDSRHPSNLCRVLLA